jgi:hypothetical protein
MKLNPFKISALAFAALALVATSAQAQSTLNYNEGDLLLGFDNGGTSDYVMDLGSATQFTTTASFTLTGLGNFQTDLSNTFGSSWNSTSTVLWGAGAENSANDALWATSSTSTPWHDSFDQSTPVSALDTIGTNSYAGSTSTANSPKGLIETTSNDSSWASFESVANGGTGNSANSAGSGSLSGYFLPGIMDATSSKLYLSEMTEGSTSSGTELGYFQVNSAGTLTYTGVSAVPEPSTYALMILGGVLMLGWKFGRRSNMA